MSTRQSVLMSRSNNVDRFSRARIDIAARLLYSSGLRPLGTRSRLYPPELNRVEGAPRGHGL